MHSVSFIITEGKYSQYVMRVLKSEKLHSVIH
jgi:hypothetical protein